MLQKRTALALLVLTLTSTILPNKAFAQFDPGEKDLFQFEQWVGVLWVPERLPEACEYQEHWFLFPDYQYPGRDNPIETTIKPNDEHNFENLEHFLEVMEQENPGGRHITTIAIEHRENCP